MSESPSPEETPPINAGSPSRSIQELSPELVSLSLDDSRSASLSTLPPELQRQIVESSIPRTFHTRTYFKRQSTLRSLCLVSNKFRQIAQPLLFEIAWLESPHRRAIWKRNVNTVAIKEGLSRSVKTVVLGSEDEEKKEKEGEIERLLRQLSMLRSITLFRCLVTETTLSVLSSLVHLSSLHLIHCDMASGSLELVPLVELRDLTLRGTSRDLTIALLDPEVVPKLELFALEGRHQATYDAILKSPLRQRLPQLTAIFFDLRAWVQEDASFLRPFAYRALVTFKVIEVVEVLSPANMIINARWSRKADYDLDLVAELDHLSTRIAQSPQNLPLRRLYLDPSLSGRQSRTEEVRQSAEKLAAVCEQRQIEIVYEPVFAQWTSDPYISVEFARLQKDLRRKERLEGK